MTNRVYLRGKKMSPAGGTFSAVRITKGQLSKAKHPTVSLNLNLLYLVVLEIKMASYKVKDDITLLMFLMYFKTWFGLLALCWINQMQTERKKASQNASGDIIFYHCTLFSSPRVLYNLSPYPQVNWLKNYQGQLHINGHVITFSFLLEVKLIKP